MSYYIIRLDDICATMDWNNFSRIAEILSSCDTKPLIAVTPDNKDKDLIIEKPKPEFWEIMRSLKNRGWSIAQHGYQHIFLTKNSGILGINAYSEFAGLSYEEQYEKVYKGRKILEQNGLQTDIWAAPAHSLDKITCKVLKDLNFQYISDDIAMFPFERFGLIWVPQQLWSLKQLPIGIFTICVHPNRVDDNQFKKIEKFIIKNHARIIPFYEAVRMYRNSQIMQRNRIWAIMNRSCKIPFYAYMRLKGHKTRRIS